MSAPHDGDKSAAFSGLILGSIAIFVLMFAVVRLTNAHYDKAKAQGGHGAAGATAPAAAPAAPAAPAAAPTAH